MTASFTRTEILDQLDTAVASLDFPSPEPPYAYPIEARLHAYRDDARWALVIETVGFNFRAWAVLDHVHVFGNCVAGPVGSTNDDFLYRSDLQADLAGYGDDDLGDDGMTPNPPLTHITVGGVRVALTDPDAFDLAAAFRSILPEHRELYLASEDELRRRIPADLPKVLQLEEWSHDTMLTESASGSQTWELLADVLTSGDPTRWAPTEAPDTHWSNWPEAGAM